jgi:asparagine synthase (glutamine-hydrolysing)
MCGITGIYAFNQLGRLNMINLAKATEALASRGPDNQGHFHNDFVGLGHRRLSIIDTSPEANQPMTDSTGRYTIVFNGEVYNFKALRASLESKGIQFYTHSDTEVLLQLYILDGIAGIDKLNGFFAFAVYDKDEHELIIARDRFGIKPLHYFIDQDKILFGSEVKSILAYGIEKKLDTTALYTYLQLNYLPAPASMFVDMKKLLPGKYIRVKDNSCNIESYYNVEERIQPFSGSFYDAVKQFQQLMETSVTDRLVADVPLGTFLSGGLDSTVVTAIASRNVDKLKTFSIGFKDEPFFDETNYANKAAKLLNTDHSVFKLSNNDLYAYLHDMLDYLDEPFADSSALAVYILSKETRKNVTVALSGDGADELFAGYNKHAALLKMFQGGVSSSLATGFSSVWKLMPKSRNGALANKIRQLDKFAKATKLNPQERYWMLASIADKLYASDLLAQNDDPIDFTAFEELRSSYLGSLQDKDISSNLLVDLKLVLPNDMLTKVDLMSMAHSLEVRVPFLDHRIVEFAFGLPDSMKITSNIRKRVVQEAFKGWIPPEIYNRGKKGFEVPLLKWFRTEMKSTIMDDLLEDQFIRDQGIFNPIMVKQLKKQLFSRNPGDVHAKIWALIVFQHWWKRNFLLNSSS